MSELWVWEDDHFCPNKLSLKDSTQNGGSGLLVTEKLNAVTEAQLDDMMHVKC